MVVFHKNGQGFWDFDHDFLHSQTSYEFAQEIEYSLKNIFHTAAIDIQYISTKDFVYIEIYTKMGAHVYVFDKVDKDFERQFMNYRRMKRILEHSERKLGMYHGFKTN